MYSAGYCLPPSIPSVKVEVEQGIVLLLGEVLLLYMSHIQVQTLAAVISSHCQDWEYNTNSDIMSSFIPSKRQ